MSNNQLIESDKVKYIPKLRFTEFKNENSWKKKQLQNVCEINPQSKKLPNSFIYIDLESVNDGRLLKRQRVNVENAPSRAQRVLQINDILFQTVRPYQKNNYLFLIKDKYEYIASTGYAQLRAKESVRYLYQYIHTDNFVDAVLEKCTGTNYPAINSIELAKLDILIPNLAEQAKIAACLSSLDELIQNESSKLETYKQHKIGLLQQLFLKDGGRVPTVRFEGFSRGWEESSSEKIFSRIKTKNLVGEKNVLTISAQKGLISQEEYFNKSISSKDVSGYYLIKKGEFAYNKSYSAGYPMGAIKKLSRYKQGVVSPLYICFSVDEKIMDSEFFQYYCDGGFLNSELGKIAQEGSRNHGLLNIGLNDFFKNIIFKIPKKNEQEKIALCLTSLDKIIATQSEYIDQLKKHKKGLMQQLFPMFEEASA